MRRVFKYLLYIGVAILFSGLMPIPVVAGAIVYFGYKGYQAFKEAFQPRDDRSGRTAERDGRREGRTETESESNTRKASNDRSQGESRGIGSFLKSDWNRSSLPLDVSKDYDNGRSAIFTMAGIPGLVAASHGLLSRPEYSFELRDVATASSLEEHIRSNGIGAGMYRNDDGSFTVSAGDIATINGLAKRAFPPREVEVGRTVTRGRQYLVSGASSYEDAVEKLKSGHYRGRLVNDYTVSEDFIDGVSLPRRTQRSRLTASSLDENAVSAGDYLVTVEQVMQSSGKMSVPDVGGNVIDQDYFDAHFRSNGPNMRQENSLIYSDGVAEGYVNGKARAASRFIELEAGHKLAVIDPADRDAVAREDLKMYVIADSMDALKGLSSGHGIPSGTDVIVARKAPDVPDGSFVIGLPLADGVLPSSVSLKGSLPEDVYDYAEDVGVSREVLDFSRLVERATAPGSIGTEAVLKEPVSPDTMSAATVFGVPVVQFIERTENRDALMPELTRAEAERWAREAAEIKFVNFEIDKEKQVLRITSVIGDNGVKTQEKPLSDEQIKSLESLGGVGSLSRTHMKDLLMQFHPDYFKTYSDSGGRSVLQDPMEAFIRGERPVHLDGVARGEHVFEEVAPKVRRRETKKGITF